MLRFVNIYVYAPTGIWFTEIILICCECMPFSWMLFLFLVSSSDLFSWCGRIALYHIVVRGSDLILTLCCCIAPVDLWASSCFSDACFCCCCWIIWPWQLLFFAWLINSFVSRHLINLSIYVYLARLLVPIWHVYIYISSLCVLAPSNYKLMHVIS